MEKLVRDIREGARSLVRDKTFAIAVALTLAVCLGANTTMFAIVYAVLLRPLPVPEADRIMLVSNKYPRAGVGENNNSSGGDYYDRIEGVKAFDHHAMFRVTGSSIGSDDGPERVIGMAATPSLFRLLGVPPALGRAFTDEEGEIGGETKVILSDGLWRRLFNADPGVSGRTLRMSGRQFTVVGVMPPGFTFVDPEARFWTPLALTAEQKQGRHSNNWIYIGRLRPGATLAEAQAQVNAVNATNRVRFPQWNQLLDNAGFHTRVEPLQEMLVRDVRATLYLLWGGAAFVLLMGVLNIANLAVARLSGRRKEIATRLALGAGRTALTRRLMVEHVMLAIAGGAAGLVLALAALRALAAVGLDRLPRAAEVRVDAPVALAALAMSVAAGVLIALLPLAQAFRTRLTGVLQEESRGGTRGRRARAIRRTLVVAQVGVAFVLLAGAALLAATFRELVRVDPGFSTDRLATASSGLPFARYPRTESVAAFMRRALEAIRAIPGVERAAAANNLPLAGVPYSDQVVLAEGYQMRPGESVISPKRLAVTPDYFETMKIGLVRGRSFDDRDDGGAPLVAIVDETLAAKFWPGVDPVSRRLYYPDGIRTQITERTRFLKVVGVARSVRLEDLSGRGAPVGVVYHPFAQSPSWTFTFAVRTSRDPAAVTRAMRRAIASIDPELALFETRSMADRAMLSLASRRTSMAVSAAFGGVALLLAALGIYGVLAYLVAQRRREIGIRIALGSTAAGVAGLVLREGLALVAAGVAIGLAGAAAMRTAVENQVYGVAPLDPVVLGGAGALLAAVALAACLAPARRASRVDPAAVLSEL
jgi:predicted permease